MSDNYNKAILIAGVIAAIAVALLGVSGYFAGAYSIGWTAPATSTDDLPHSAPDVGEPRGRP